MQEKKLSMIKIFQFFVSDHLSYTYRAIVKRSPYEVRGFTHDKTFQLIWYVFKDTSYSDVVDLMFSVERPTQFLISLKA